MNLKLSRTTIAYSPRRNCFSRVQERLTFDVPVGFADPHVIPRHDQHDANPAVISAIAAVRPIRPAAVLVPIIERDELSVLFTQRTGHLADHAGPLDGDPANRKRECWRTAEGDERESSGRLNVQNPRRGCKCNAEETSRNVRRAG